MVASLYSVNWDIFTVVLFKFISLLRVITYPVIKIAKINPELGASNIEPAKINPG